MRFVKRKCLLQKVTKIAQKGEARHGTRNKKKHKSKANKN